MDLPGETLEPGKPEGNAKSKMRDDLEYIECQKRTGTEVGMIGMMVGARPSHPEQSPQIGLPIRDTGKAAVSKSVPTITSFRRDRVTCLC